MIKKSIPIIAAFAASFASTIAAEDPSGQCLSIEDAVEAASLSDPRADRAYAAYADAAANADLARSAGRPQFSAFSRGGIGDGRLQSSQVDNSVGVQVKQELFSFGATKNSIRASRHAQEAAAHEEKSVQREIMLEAADAYLSARRFGALAKIRGEKEAYFVRDARAAKQMLEARTITVTDASELEAAANLAESERINAGFQRDNALLALEILIDKEMACGVLPDPTPTIHHIELSLNEAHFEDLAGAINGHPAILAAEASAESASRRHTSAKRSQYPRVQLSAFRAYEYDDTENRWRDRDRVGVDFVYDFYSGGSARANVRKADAALRSAHAQRKQLERRLLQELRSKLILRRTQKSNISALQAAVGNYRRQLIGLESQYDAGAVTAHIVAEGARSYFEAQEMLIGAIYEYQSLLYWLHITTNGNEQNQIPIQ